MNVGTRSILYGAHAFWLHPWFVAWGWWRLYGFPWDPRLWVEAHKDGGEDTWTPDMRRGGP